MKYISLQKYDQEFSGQGVKYRLFYNPNDTVAIFEPGFDDDIWPYIMEKGFALKESGFIMNAENAAIIREFIAQQKGEKEVLENIKVDSFVTPNLIDPHPYGLAKVATPQLGQDKLENWIFELESKPTVAKLAVILKEILQEFETSRSQR
jgi:hypothetical protein